MVGTIVPMVYGDRMQGRRSLASWLYGLGCISGSMVAAIGVSFLGATIRSRAPINSATAALLIGILGFAYSLRELGFVVIPVPVPKRQVSARWRSELPQPLAATLYGTILGCGVLTRLPSATLVVCLSWVLLRPGPAWEAMVVVAFFGVGRWLQLLPFVRARPPDAFDACNRVRPYSPVVRILNGLALAAAGSSFLIFGLRPGG